MSFGVIIPTLNCARFMDGHIDSILPWLSKAEEVVVIDSGSADGTLEMIARRIFHPNLQVHQHPRGIYQAWNCGIERIKSKYTYISTVGDSITAHGIDHLLQVAEKHDADVVVSAPKFINENGFAALKPPSFPVENLTKKLNIKEARLLTDLECFDFIISNFPNAILGSSASNIYKTKTMKQKPFPVSYGTAGDGAWGISHALTHRIAVTPLKFSTFRVHEKSYSKLDYEVDDFYGRLMTLFEESTNQWIDSDSPNLSQEKGIMIRNALDQLRESLNCQKDLQKIRSQRLPWIFNPRAWDIRARRAKTRQNIEILTRTLQAG